MKRRGLYALILEKVAEIKATHQLLLADAWVATSAIQQKTVFVLKDPEFSKLEYPRLLFPYKKLKSYSMDGSYYRKPFQILLRPTYLSSYPS